MEGSHISINQNNVGHFSLRERRAEAIYLALAKVLAKRFRIKESNDKWERYKRSIGR